MRASDFVRSGIATAEAHAVNMAQVRACRTEDVCFGWKADATPTSLTGYTDRGEDVASDSRYLKALLLSFFLPILAGMLLAAAGFETNATNVVMWIASSLALYVVLRGRARHLRLNPNWAFIAALPAFAFLVGIFFYFRSPATAD